MQTQSLSTDLPPYAAKSLPVRLKALRWLGRQPWIPKGKDFILRSFCDPGRCDPFPFDVDFFGYRYRGNLAHYIDWYVFMYGSYARWELDLLERLARAKLFSGERVTFYDVGANAGNHTLFMARFADRVIAFEPFPKVRQLIEDKIAVNKLSRVSLFPVALGDQDSVAAYHQGDGRNTGSGTLLDHQGADAAALAVQVKRGDTFIQENNLPSPNIIKIDVEGYEPFVLRGLAGTIQARKPSILMELSDGSLSNMKGEEEFRSLLYPDAAFFEVSHKADGRRFKLTTFQYAQSRQVLVIPKSQIGGLAD